MTVENTEAPQEPGRTGPPSDVGGSALNLSDIADNLAQTMPDVQPHAVEARRADIKNNSGKVSTVGTVFDPAIHAVDEGGNPYENTRGDWTKKRGRKAGGSANVARSRVGSGVPQIDPAAAKVAQARQAGQGAAGAVIMACVALFGDEWKPVKDEESGLDEFQMQSEAWATWLAAHNMTDLPPGVALCIALMAYAGPRFALPKTQTRLAKMKNWAVAKWIAWRARKRA